MASWFPMKRIRTNVKMMLAEADTSPSFGTMADIASVQVNPAGNDVDIEIFIASA